MVGLANLRKAVSRLVRGDEGKSYHSPNWTAQQVRAQNFHSEILGLPVCDDGYEPVQDLNGSFYSMLDVMGLDQDPLP